jgi:DNA-binding beta-propeller fold protein YncE
MMVTDEAVAYSRAMKLERLAPALLSLAAAAAACGGSSVQPGDDAGVTSGPDGGAPPPTSLPPLPPLTGATLIFESGPVRPVALSPDGTHLYVANIPDGHLEILRVGGAGGLTLEASVPVGVDPVAVAVRNAGEVWVVNQVSDSVSIVDVASAPPRVVRTLLVGDEPSDIVFAGTGRARAFITTAHRGQRRGDPALAAVPGADDPQLTTPGVGRADVWVFDAGNLGTSAGGVPLRILGFAGDTPRALAVSPDGATVYAAVFKSGNQTTVTAPGFACTGFDVDTSCQVNGTTVPGSPLGPGTNHAGIAAPVVGLIVKGDDSGHWYDGRHRDWGTAIRFRLPDRDVFAVDADTLSAGAVFQHVGTTLFNMAVNPQSGALYVSNTESRNDLRFEGPGTFAGFTLQGHLAESRITVIQGGTVAPRRLNKHIDYSVRPAPAAVNALSLATPLDMAVSADGNTLYVAAFGSGKVGVLSTAALEADNFMPGGTGIDYLPVTGGGPGGLALDDANQRLFVATRFDDGVSMIDLATHREVAHVTFNTPETPDVVKGRPFLYDATRSSSNGEAACASCHMFGDKDQLAWDLGNPDGDQVQIPSNVPIKLVIGARGTINGTGSPTLLHPMKGPMTTQTLRGLVNHGDMHWRGDRVSGYFGTDANPAPPYDSQRAFANFIVAFQGLLGRDAVISTDDMVTFARFTLSIAMPPNPIRALDNSLTASQARGRTFFMGCDGLDSMTGVAATCTNGRPLGVGHFADGVALSTVAIGFTCEGCHTLRPENGFFGTDGQFSFEGLPQIMKIPQLRNVYDKVGMFGQASVPGFNAIDNGDKGEQVRGFGFENEGSTDTLFRFFQANVFNSGFSGKVGFSGTDPQQQRRDVEQFVLAFDSDLAPIVGQQITLGPDDSDGSAAARVDLLLARAAAPFASKILGGSVTECDLVATGVVAGAARAFRLRPDGMFDTDGAEAPITATALRDFAKTAGQQITFTCLPPGAGARVLDRDGDGVKNQLDACPADPSCH